MTSLPALNFAPQPRAATVPQNVVFTSPVIIESTPHIQQLEIEIDQLSGQLAQTFEELNLIHDLACNLDAVGDRIAHCRNTLDKLAVCLPVPTVAIVWEDEDRGLATSSSAAAAVVQSGEPVDAQLLRGIAAELGDGDAVVANYSLRSAPDLDRAISVRLESGMQNGSRLIAIGSPGGAELGTVEVQLMQSVASILRAHLAIDQQFAEMRSMFAGTVLSLVSAVDAKDPYTCGHSNRVSLLAELLAGDLGYDAEGVETVRMAGLLHDIGKIGVPDAILGKPGRLTEEEFDQMKKHPELGYGILRGVRQFERILPGVRYHHESWDGTGYPEGLAGEDIPQMARILAVADAFDAMSSDRPYRAGMPLDGVIAIFRKGRGQQWDAEIVDWLLSDRARMEQFIQQRDSLGTQLPSFDLWSGHRIGSN